MAGLSNRMSAVMVASAFFLLTIAVHQASGARVLKGARPGDVSVAIPGPGLGDDPPVIVRGYKIKASPWSEDCGRAGNNKLRNVLLLDGFLPRGTQVPPSGPSKRSNTINN